MTDINHSESSENTTQNRREQLDGHLSPPTVLASSEDTIANRNVNSDPSQPQPRSSSQGPRRWLVIAGASVLSLPRKWLLIAGAIALLIGAGVTWRMSQGSNAEGEAPPGQGQSAATPVKIVPVQSGRVADSSEFVASLRSPESVTLRPQIQGRVSQIFAREGDTVRAGAPILQIDPDEQAAAMGSTMAATEGARSDLENARATLSSLQAERISAVSNQKFTQRQSERYSSLAAQGAVARQQRDEFLNNFQAARASLGSIDERIRAQRAAVARATSAVEQAQANAQEQKVQLQYFKPTAPFAGIVGDIPVQVGDLVDTSTVLVTVTQNQSLEVNVSVPTERASELRLGLPVELINAQGQPVGTSQISFISPDVNNETQSVLIRSIFNNSGGRLRTDQFTRARVIWSQRPGVVIPVTAITRLGGESFVFVAEAGPQQGQPQAGPQQEGPQLIARQKRVKLGPIQGNNYQVLEGLQPGDRLITSGILNLRDGGAIAPGP